MRGPLPLRRIEPVRMRGALGTEAVSPFLAAGEHPLCAWDECDRKAVEGIHIVEPDGTREVNVWWYFCSEPHKALHANSHREMGRIAPGQTVSPRYI